MTDLIAELAEVVRQLGLAFSDENEDSDGSDQLWANSRAGHYLCTHHAELTQALAAHEALVNRMNAAESALRQAHKDYGFEIRDPNGTIWEACKRLQKENEQLRKDRKCRHMFGADGDGSSCYLCGSPNPRHKY